jgi:hypothetical protein
MCFVLSLEKKQIPLPRLRDRNDKQGDFHVHGGPKAHVTLAPPRLLAWGRYSSLALPSIW